MSGVPALISVVITSFNYLQYITKAIDSVLAQTYPRLEIVVVDNCSTDGTVPALRERYAGESRVSVHQNETNIGEIKNSSRGFELTTGEFVLWLSADDWLLPRHLERLHAAFARTPEIDVVYSSAYFANKEGRLVSQRQLNGSLPFDYVDARDELIEMLTNDCPLCWPAALFRRATFIELGLFDPEGPHAADWEMQVRIAIAGKRFAYLHDASCVVRRHPGQQTNMAYVSSGRIVDDFVKILEKYVDDPRIERLRGREAGTVRLLDWLIGQSAAVRSNAPLPPAIAARADSVRERLNDRAATYEPARVRDRTISVIVTGTTAPQLVARAMASVASQSHPNWEIVFLDRLPFSLEEWLRGEPVNARVSYARSSPGVGPARARNLSLRLARGEYVTFLDENNVYAPQHLENLVSAIEQTGTSVAATGAVNVLELADPRMLDFRELHRMAVHRMAGDPPEISLLAPALPLDAVMLYRHVLDRGAAAFDEQLAAFEDYEYVLRLEHTVPTAFTPTATVEVRARLGGFAQRLPHYLPALDQIYASFPVAPALAMQRAAHRAALELAVARVIAEPMDVDATLQLMTVMAGRGVLPAVPSGGA